MVKAINLCSPKGGDDDDEQNNKKRDWKKDKVIDLCSSSSEDEEKEEKCRKKKQRRPLIEFRTFDGCPMSGDWMPFHRSSYHSSQFKLYHIRQRDRWSCGYRNLQMLLASRGGGENIPSLYALQENLQDAWKEGMDPRGALHYNYRIIGKKEWIGAVEVCTIL